MFYSDLSLDVLQYAALMLLFLVITVDQVKEATFKVAPSKWEAVDEAELEAQGKMAKYSHKI